MKENYTRRAKMRIYLTSDKTTIYKEYVIRTNKLNAKHGTDKSPMGFDEFSRAFRNLTIATRENRWSAETIMNKLVKTTVEEATHSQALAASKANPDYSYNEIRYGNKFWDMVKSTYKQYREGGANAKGASIAIAHSIFGSL